jgi:hypothetical protein
VIYTIMSTIALMAFSSVFFEGAEEVPLLLSVTTITPVMLLIAIVVIVFLAKQLIDLAKKAALLIFDAASAPEVSPFSYAAALLGILVLGAKLALGSSSE